MAPLGIAEVSAGYYRVEPDRAGLRPITATIAIAGAFYYAEDEHQQYLSRNPDGYSARTGWEELSGWSRPIDLKPMNAADIHTIGA